MFPFLNSQCVIFKDLLPKYLETIQYLIFHNNIIILITNNYIIMILTIIISVFILTVTNVVIISRWKEGPAGMMMYSGSDGIKKHE